MQIEDSLLDQKPKKTLFSLPTSILQRDWLPNIFLYQKPLKVSTEILNINDHSYVSGSQKRPMDILCGWEDAVHCGKLLHKLFLSVTEKTCWGRAKLPLLCVCVRGWVFPLCGSSSHAACMTSAFSHWVFSAGILERRCAKPVALL